MSLGVCIPELIEQGKIPKGKGREAKKLYDELLARYDQEMGDAAAKAAATTRTLEILKADAIQSRRRKFMSIAAAQSAETRMRSFNGGVKDGAPIDPRSGAALIVRDDRARFSRLELRKKEVKVRVHGMVDRMLADLRKTMIGQVRDPVLERDMVRALNGEPVENVSAREIAESVRKALDYLRQRFNAAGGAIGKLEGYDLPHRWSAAQVRKATFEQFAAEVMPRLDRGRMIDRSTGMAFTDEAMLAALKDVYDGIRTEGWDTRAPGMMGMGAVATRHAEERFLHFRTAEDWMAVNDRFGAAGAFDTLMGHFEVMSRDIAAMEILGPNPQATIKYVGDLMVKEAQTKGDGDAINKAMAAAAHVRDLWDEYSGARGAPVNERLARNFGTVRAVQTSAKLGSAIISAVGDFAMTAMTRKFNGLPVMSMFSDYLRLMRPGSAEDVRLAIHMGALADEWAESSAAMNRLAGEELSGELANRMANFTLRASGLSRHTMMLRASHAKQVVGLITREAETSFTKLHPDFRAMLDRYAIGADDWNKIRATAPQRDHRGAEWILPKNIRDQAAAGRMIEMIQGETDFAVPAVDLRTRATMNSLGRRGTWTGEIARSTFLFKSFGLTVLNLHGRRALAMDRWDGLKYAATLTALTTLAGAVAVQMKQIQQGKEPLPQSKAFWGKAMLQGGGWGIFGDFIGASENRFGGGLGVTATGPMFQTGSNVADLTFGNAFKAARGEETDFWNGTLKVLRQEVPVVSSLWYVKPLYQRGVIDAIDRLADPEHEAKRARLLQRAEDEDAPYFWEPE